MRLIVDNHRSGEENMEALKEELHIRVLLIILLFFLDFSYQMDLQLTSSDSSVHNMSEQA